MTDSHSSTDQKIEYYSKWQAPDRDSASTIEFQNEPFTKLGDQLSVLLRMDGANGMDEDAIKRATGAELKRPRRWHKIYERMGLMYRVGNNTQISPLGRMLLDLDNRIKAESKSIPREIARHALAILVKYQLNNPLENGGSGQYPASCTVHPYYAILRAADELDGKIHWDELNRELMRIMTDEELEEAIDRIKVSREQPDYNPEKGGSAKAPLRDRCYDQKDAPMGKTPEGQIRDQKTTPWFRRAGFGGLLLSNPGQIGQGYWSIPEDVRDLVHQAVSSPPVFMPTESVEDWQAYFCSLSSDSQPVKDVAELDFVKILPALKLVAPELSFSEKLVACLVTSLNASENGNFVILKGVSGTGKTRIVSTLAKAVYEDRELTAPELTMIPVRPDWTDSAPLLGYYSPIEQKYVSPPFLQTLIEAKANKGKPYFVCLDEMNLARVEYYLAECLSAMESGEPIAIERQSDTSVPERIWWPKNLYLFGTINVDESTLSISDKVLDRAQVIDTSEIVLEPLVNRWLNECINLEDNEKTIVQEILLAIWNQLKVNHSHFGFRTAKAIIKYIDEAVGRSAGHISLLEAIDSQIVQKILPKLRGDEDQWIDTLESLASLTSSYPNTRKVIDRMKVDMERYGNFQYWS